MKICPNCCGHLVKKKYGYLKKDKCMTCGYETCLSDELNEELTNRLEIDSRVTENQ